ncbi:MAG: hypothetical protein ACLUIX_10465 [Oscillospiraceae bacterium]
MGNYQTLLDAEAKLADLQAVDAVEKLIDAIGTVTLDSEELSRLPVVLRCSDRGAEGSGGTTDPAGRRGQAG